MSKRRNKIQYDDEIVEFTIRVSKQLLDDFKASYKKAKQIDENEQLSNSYLISKAIYHALNSMERIIGKKRKVKND